MNLTKEMKLARAQRALLDVSLLFGAKMKKVSDKGKRHHQVMDSWLIVDGLVKREIRKWR